MTNRDLRANRFLWTEEDVTITMPQSQQTEPIAQYETNFELATANTATNACETNQTAELEAAGAIASLTGGRLDQVQPLLELGFEAVGAWKLELGHLRYELSKHGDKDQVLYAFVAGSEVLYVGKSVQTLTKRLYGYQKPGPTQRTNIRNHAFLKALLTTGRPVEIWVLVVTEPVFYCGWPLNVAAGLEDAVIAHLSPAWNLCGASKL